MPRNEKSKLRLMLLLPVMLLAATGSLTRSVNAQCARPGFKLADGDFSANANKLVTGDFNADGKADVATIGNESGKVAVYLSDGSGNLGAPVIHLVGSGYRNIFAADINNDARPDLVIASTTGSNILHLSILWNTGSGAFGFPTTVSLALPEFYFETLQIRDMNADGKADLIAANQVSSNSVIQVRIGDGGGNFTPPFNYQVSSDRGYVIGDFNGDNKNDLAAVMDDNASRKVRMYINDGSGVLLQGPDIMVGTNTNLNIARDLNGDGKIDLAGTTPSANAVTILFNNGMGGFTRTDHPVLAWVLTNLQVGDFNGDGKLDLITAQLDMQTPAANSTILFGDGMGGFTRSDERGVSFGWITNGGVGDFNADGKTDIVTTGFNFVAGSGIVLNLRTCNAVGHTKRVDYDGDTLGDFAVWRPGTGVWMIQQSYTNTLRTVQWGMGSLGDVPVPGDYDGDGKSDLAVFRHGVWYVLKSSDGSSFGVQWGLSGDKPVPGDYDADGKTDFAVFRPSNGGWFILRSSDSALGSYYFGTLGDKPAQADFDGDDKTDVAVFRPSNGHWYMLRSSDGSFFAQHYGLGSDLPVPGDYDSDGKADIAVYRQDAAYYFLRSWNNTTLGLSIGAYQGATGQVNVFAAPLSNGDYMNPSVWRSNDGMFAYFFQSFALGASGDIPVTAPYVIE